jgi:hypothetical protein
MTPLFGTVEFVLNGINSTLPVLRATGAGSGTELQANLAGATSQPFSLSTLFRAIASPTRAGYFGSTTTAGIVNGTDVVTLWAGNNGGNVSATSGVAHALQGFYNGAGSLINVDGTQTSQSPGAGSLNSQVIWFGMSGFDTWDGDATELALWNGDQSSSFAALHTNQSAYWGTA